MKIIIVTKICYVFETIYEELVSKWKEDSAHNLFGAMEMTAIDMATMAMQRAIEEINNGNAKKGTNTMSPLEIALHMPERILTEEEMA